MKRSNILGLVMAITLALSSVGVVWAQDAPPDGTTDALPVDGTVIGINTLPDGSVTVDVRLADGTVITIPVDDSYDHPIVALLAEYFGGAGVEEWSAALADLTVEIDELGNTDTVIGVSEVTDPVTGEVIGWTLELAGSGTLSTSDAEQVERILAALAVVNVGLNTTTTGDGGLEPPVPGEEPSAPTYELVTVGGQIQAYHDDGMGFGVLTKLYAMAQESGHPVDTLVTAFKSGTGMGQLFKENGKPSLLGVGHVRKELKDQQNGDAAKVNKGQAKKDAKPDKEGKAKGKNKKKK